ncbi:MAG: NAD-dependent epimerase/dehydratase family protein [Terriglobales bacterium]
MARILITGGSGFIGTNLLERYRSEGHDLLNIDCKPPRNAAHQRFWTNVDILNKELVHKVTREFDPDFLFHLAARTDLDGKTLDDYAANTTGTLNVIEAISGLMRLKRILFTSTRLVCRIGYVPQAEADYCPTTTYGASKIAMEQLIRDADNRIPCSWTIFRPTSIWGPWFDVPYKTFFTAIAKGHYVHPGNRTIKKSYGYVGNVVVQLQRAMMAPAEATEKKTFYLADYQPLDVHEWAELIQKTMRTSKIRTVPVSALRPIALLGDIAKKAGWSNPFLTSFRLDNLLTEMVYDVEPLQRIAGPTPYSLEDGVKETVDWMHRHGELG